MSEASARGEDIAKGWAGQMDMDVGARRMNQEFVLFAISAGFFAVAEHRALHRQLTIAGPSGTAAR